MTWLEWALGFMLLSLYITCLFTVCSMTFQKGRTVLGIVGIFAPWLWLIGAFLPAKPGSRYALAQQAAGQRPVAQPALMRRRRAHRASEVAPAAVCGAVGTASNARAWSRFRAGAADTMDGWSSTSPGRRRAEA